MPWLVIAAVTVAGSGWYGYSVNGRRSALGCTAFASGVAVLAWACVAVAT